MKKFWEISLTVFVDVIGGVFAAFLVSFLFKLNFSVPFYLFGISAALFPDIDFLIRFLVEGKVLDLDGVSHRNYLHYPFWIVVIFGGFFYFYLGPEYGLLFTVGVLYHFLHDSVDDSYGVFWLWPFSKLRYQFYPPRSYTKEQIIHDLKKSKCRHKNMLIAISAQNFFAEYPTGVDFYTREIVKNLSETCEAKDQIIVYVKNLPADSQSEAVEFLYLRNVSFKELKFKKFFNLIGVANAISKDRPDILFCPESIITLWSFCKIIFVVHGVEFKIFPKAYSFLSRVWFELSTWFSIKRSVAILAPSQATKNDLIKYYKVNPEKIFVIRHGPIVNFKPTEFILGGKNPEQILFLGRIEKRKNLEILIEAFEKIHSKFLGASLILAGKNGFGSEKILSKIKKSAAKDQIFLEGYIDEKKKKDLLLRSGILVFPSNAEGFGFPILEGQAAKCAVVCSDLEVLKEVADDGALFFKRQDSNDLAQKLLDIMMNNETRSRLVSNSAKNLERFSWKESAQKTYDVMKKINEKD